MIVRFLKHCVKKGDLKARVFYALDNRGDGRKVVTIYAKDYCGHLGKIFVDEHVNNSDMMTDYFEKDTVRIFEDHPLYAELRKFVEGM